MAVLRGGLWGHITVPYLYLHVNSRTIVVFSRLVVGFVVNGMHSSQLYECARIYIYGSTVTIKYPWQRFFGRLPWSTHCCIKPCPAMYNHHIMTQASITNQFFSLTDTTASASAILLQHDTSKRGSNLGQGNYVTECQQYSLGCSHFMEPP
jgi:hypothetical protein